MFAEVVPIGIPLSASFHYDIPPDLEARLAAGHLVQVQFGNQRVQGVVVALSDDPPDGIDQFKSIEALIDDQPVLTRAQLDLAYRLSHRTLAAVSDCISLMLPPGLAKRGDVEYSLTDVSAQPDDDRQYRLIKLLEERGALRGKQLNRAFGRMAWRPAIDKLIKRNVVAKRSVLDPPSVRPRQIRTARCIVPPWQLRHALLSLNYSPAIADALEHLLDISPAQPALPDLLKTTGGDLQDIALMAQRGWVTQIPSDLVVVANRPPGALAKWAEGQRQSDPPAAEFVRALSEQPAESAIPLSQLPALTIDHLTRLEGKNLLRFANNPPRVALAISGAIVTRQAARLRQQNKRAEALSFLAKENRPVPVSWVYAETGASASTLKDLADRGLVDLGEEEFIRDPLANEVFVPSEPPPLTANQVAVWEAIESAFNLLPAATPMPPFLLHGVTGSGKTEIYLRAVAKALAQGKQAIVLVPEIALTPQTVRRFAARFIGRVTVVHSQLSAGERYDTWRRARAGAVDVVVGARSALFAPLPEVGLIVVDEEHDEAYQQDGNFGNLYYNARDAAVEYARQLGAICILGSATPDVVSYARAGRGDYRLVALPQRIMAHGDYVARQTDLLRIVSHYQPLSPDGIAQSIDLPNVSVVDMRQELRAGNRSMFSRALQSALQQTLTNNEQALLFLNRRGTATYVFCRDCGDTLACRRCGIALTFHSASTQLVCHHCGNKQRQPDHCPTCHSARIRYFGTGTEKVEAELREMFPQAQPLRWDSDTARVKGAHDLILRHFKARLANVLIGTQMIAKGHDLPLVTLVGVISADVGLSLPDYRAAERVFQVLAQVAGRAGRSLLGGQVVLQTYHPDHYVIAAAAGHNYAAFYERELGYRREHGYPPFGKLARLVFQSHNAEFAETEARRMADHLRSRLIASDAASTTLIGPAPCFFQRLAGKHRWQIIVRGPNPMQFVDGIKSPGWAVEIDPLSLL